jgi:uncharacterized membrane protein
MRTLLLLGLLALTGCGTAPTATGATCPTGSTLTYDNFGKAFMSNYCTRCHSSTLSGSARQNAPAGTDFDSVANIRNDLLGIDREAAASAAVSNTDMPEGSPSPTAAERKQLGEWLACGAP